MNKMSLTETATLIKELHGDQVDKSGAPYWLHPVAVMGMLKDIDNDTIKYAALLHDVLEDTDTTLEDLFGYGFDSDTVYIVRMVSFLAEDKYEQTYLQWINWIATTGDINSMLVKYADLLHNSHPHRIVAFKGKGSMAKRYQKAMEILEKVIPQDLLDKMPKRQVGVAY